MPFVGVAGEVSSPDQDGWVPIRNQGKAGRNNCTMERCTRGRIEGVRRQQEADAALVAAYGY